MALFSSFGSKSIVGLDIGSSTVKAVELSLKGKGGGFDLTHVGVAPPSDGGRVTRTSQREQVVQLDVRGAGLAQALDGGFANRLPGNLHPTGIREREPP